ncbi:MAG: hypothetical protein ACP5NS_03500 [Candidatus Pacearchaeota archaeon]
MTQETPEAEPPDPPRREYNPKQLTFKLNGRGSPSRFFQIEDAFVDGKHFVRKYGTNVVYEQIAPNNYRCTDCDTPTKEERVSREVSRGWSNGDLILCGTAHFCPKCEPIPRVRGIKGLMERISVNTYQERLKAYEEAEKKGTQ